MEELYCAECGVLFGYGGGDLNCCDFLCPACFVASGQIILSEDLI